jgi:DNA primase
MTTRIRYLDLENMSKITYRQQKIIDTFGIDVRNTSPKGWILGGECPFCHQKDKFGIKLNHERSRYKNHISYNCFHGSCQEKGTEWLLLKEINMLHLIQDGEFIGAKDEIDKLNFIMEEMATDIDVPTRHKPFGFKRVEVDPYLKNRGFESWQYEKYHIGRTKLYDPLRDYVIFLIEEGGLNKGYVARLIWSKEKIAEEEAKGKLVLRYKNEAGVDFGKMVFGLDEIIQGTTHTVILVEGVTDKSNVDKLLQLNQEDDIKCCATFGKKVSEEQILKLWGKGIKNIIVLYDPDAVDASKQYSYNLSMWFSVKVGYLHSQDPGELNYVQLEKVLQNLQTPGQFFIDKVQKKSLK